MIAKKYKISSGVGVSDHGLVAFDKALIEAGVGNYNLVRLSSILPAGCQQVDDIDIPEGSLLPTAYSTITSDKSGEVISSAIGVGIENDSKVGVIMEYSARGKTRVLCEETVKNMISEAFEVRGWKLNHVITTSIDAIVRDGEVVTTFACISEW